MSTSYRALLQSLDETERDVTRGLGRPVQIKKGRSCCPCCCRNACMWTCMTLAILFGLTVSVGVPILLTVPIESSWHWTHWIRWMPSNPVGWNATDFINDVIFIQHFFKTDNSISCWMVWMKTNVTDWTLDGQEPETTTAVNGTVPLIHQAITQLQEMMEWTASVSHIFFPFTWLRRACIYTPNCVWRMSETDSSYDTLLWWIVYGCTCRRISTIKPRKFPSLSDCRPCCWSSCPSFGSWFTGRSDAINDVVISGFAFQQFTSFSF